MENLDLEAQLSRIFADVLVVFWQGHGAEGLNLDLPAHVHPGAVYDQDFRHTLDLPRQQGLCFGCLTSVDQATRLRPARAAGVALAATPRVWDRLCAPRRRTARCPLSPLCGSDGPARHDPALLPAGLAGCG